MARLWLAPLLLMTLGVAPSAAADPADANGVVIERVVAVVDHKAIFLSELRQRATPFRTRIDATVPADKRAAAYAQVLKDLLARMIDERLVAIGAEKERISVTLEEVDRALESVAKSQKLTVAELISEAARQGLEEREYRAELRRQLLEGKLVSRSLRKKGAPPPTAEAQAEAMKQELDKLLAALRERTFIENRL